MSQPSESTDIQSKPSSNLLEAVRTKDRATIMNALSQVKGKPEAIYSFDAPYSFQAMYSFDEKDQSDTTNLSSHLLVLPLDSNALHELKQQEDLMSTNPNRHNTVPSSQQTQQSTDQHATQSQPNNDTQSINAQILLLQQRNLAMLQSNIIPGA